jgi:hypothetical protein
MKIKRESFKNSPEVLAINIIYMKNKRGRSRINDN